MTVDLRSYSLQPQRAATSKHSNVVEKISPTHKLSTTLTTISILKHGFLQGRSDVFLFDDQTQYLHDRMRATIKADFKSCTVGPKPMSTPSRQNLSNDDFS